MTPKENAQQQRDNIVTLAIQINKCEIRHGSMTWIAKIKDDLQTMRADLRDYMINHQITKEEIMI